MQWAKPPMPTTKVSIQMTMTEPVMECEPETSQAAVAMIQPPMTPDQKMAEGPWWMASAPRWARDWTTAGAEGVGKAGEGGEGEARRGRLPAGR